MRDHARIDRVLDLVRRYWKKHPDMRLMQLLLNATSAQGPFNRDPYDIEEDHLEGLMVRLYGGYL